MMLRSRRGESPGGDSIETADEATMTDIAFKSATRLLAALKVGEVGGFGA